MEELLIRDFGEAPGKKYFTQYSSARDVLIQDNFFSQITGAQPSLSDHGIPHIRNVLENVGKLLGDEIDQVSGMTLYCLGLVVLFHDVGNVFGREFHNKHIAEVYNHVRKKEAYYNQERSVVIAAAEAHCGRNREGGRDTLKFLDEVDNLFGEPIPLRNVAAILRFADELAEGPQRTSQFMREIGAIAEESTIHHDYASVTQMFIDRKGGRVSITYNIDIDENTTKESLNELLKHIHIRIVKVDEERRYNKHYCDLLAPFKKTTVKFNFYIDGMPAEFDLDKIEITDRFPIPGETTGGVEQLLSKNNEISIDELWTRIDKVLTKKIAENGQTA